MTIYKGAFSGKLAFLSNFYLTPVCVRGVTFASSEHAYQAAKCANPEDVKKFLAPDITPGQTKRLGRKVRLRPNWDRIKNNIMLDIVRCKFTNPVLKQKLLETNDLYLEEKNNWRDYWFGTVNGVGHNYLGKILMLVREEIKHENIS